MSQESEEWLAREFAWVDAQIAGMEAADEAAYDKFRRELLPFD